MHDRQAEGRLPWRSRRHRAVTLREDGGVESGRAERASPRSPVRLNAAQAAALAWIVEGCPDGAYPDGSYAHRITARALRNRGLIEISGHGATWRAVPTERGLVWPAVTAADRVLREPAGSTDESDAMKHTLRRRPNRVRPEKPVPIKQVSRQEGYMRYKVVVTRIQVAERWIRATDEEDAARKVREEFERPYAYFGHWETKGSEIEVVEAEQTTVIPPNLLDESGPMLLTIMDAAEALGIPHRALGELARRGEIQCTRIGSRRYVPREALLEFVRTNTQRGHSEP